MSPMRSIRGPGLWALLVSASLGACAPSLVDENFGSAQREARARQTQNPERSETRNPVSGMGAATAAEVVENYHRNQKTSAQQSQQESARDSGISVVE